MTHIHETNAKVRAEKEKGEGDCRYVPVNWDRLKKGDRVYDTREKIMGVVEYRVVNFICVKYFDRKHHRGVFDKSTAVKFLLIVTDIDEGWEKKQALNEHLAPPVLAEKEQEPKDERQYYLKLLEGFDYIPKKEVKFSVVVTKNDGKDKRFDKTGVEYSFKKRNWKIRDLHWHFSYMFYGEEYGNYGNTGNIPKEYNIFTYSIMTLIFNYNKVDDIAFMKDLWTELSRIKNESV